MLIDLVVQGIMTSGMTFGDVEVLVTETFAGWLGRVPGIWHRRSHTNRRDGVG